MNERRHACAFCTALQRLAVRRRDAGLVDAAIRLRDAHAANDGERTAFVARAGTSGVRAAHGKASTLTPRIALGKRHGPTG